MLRKLLELNALVSRTFASFPVIAAPVVTESTASHVLRRATAGFHARREFGTTSFSTSVEPHAEETPLPPWTPSRELQKRKVLTKRMGYMMQVLEKEKENEAQAQLARPDFGPGDFLELKLSVPENKRRTTLFKGICIARRNRGWRTSFTLRNFIGSSGGIERTFPL
jgi:large subunit ribosomal protein L19